MWKSYVNVFGVIHLCYGNILHSVIKEDINLIAWKRIYEIWRGSSKVKNLRIIWLTKRESKMNVERNRLQIEIVVLNSIESYIWFQQMSFFSIEKT
jgi:hypothetical protein